MRKTALLAALAIGFAAAQAQTVYFWKNNVALAVEASAAGDMVYSAGGTQLMLIDSLMNVSDIDSITIGNAIAETSVGIQYSGNTATAVIPFALSRKVSVSIDGAYVSATSSAIDGDEVTYKLAGQSTDGAFTQTGQYKCTLSLEGLSLTSKQGAAIDIANGKRINVILADGTENTLADFANGTQKGCFHVKGHPEFSGGGTLNITGNAAHGIDTGEYLEVKSGTINILSAVKDGIHAGQYFKMKNGTVTVKDVKGDGIQAAVTKDAADELNGQMLISGGKIDINIKADDSKALRSDSLMTISGGDISININGNGTKGIATDATLNIDQSTGTTKINIVINGGVYTDPDTQEDSKTRGIKCDGDLNVLGGTLVIEATGKKAKTINLDGIATRSKSATITLNDDFTFDKTVD